MDNETNTDRLKRVGPIAAKNNGEARRENEREAAEWLSDVRALFLGLKTSELSIEQLEFVKRCADEFVSRLYAEIWAKQQGESIPPYKSPEWESLYDRWLDSN